MKKGTYRVINPLRDVLIDCTDFYMVGTGAGACWVFEKNEIKTYYFPVQNTVIEKVS